MPNPTFDRRSFLAVALPGAAVATAFAQGPQQGRFLRSRRAVTGRAGAGSLIPILMSSLSTIGFVGTSSVNTTMKRLHTGTLWAEGPAWNGPGRFLDVERYSEQRATALD
jgi:gluconolactonase